MWYASELFFVVFFLKDDSKIRLTLIQVHSYVQWPMWLVEGILWFVVLSLKRKKPLTSPEEKHMVFAAVGMTDGTRICPGGHWKHEGPNPLTDRTWPWFFWLFFFLRNFCRPFFVVPHQKTWNSFNIPSSEKSLHGLLRHWWDSWWFFVVKHAPPQENSRYDTGPWHVCGNSSCWQA